MSSVMSMFLSSCLGHPMESVRSGNGAPMATCTERVRRQFVIGIQSILEEA